MKVGCVQSILQLSRKVSDGVIFVYGFKLRRGPEVDYVHVTISDKTTYVELYPNVEVDRHVNLNELRNSLNCGVGYTYKPGEAIYLPVGDYTFTLVKRVQLETNSTEPLRRQTLLLEKDEISVHHVVQVLGFLSKEYPGGLQFCLKSSLYPNDLVPVDMIKGVAMWVQGSSDEIILNKINLYKFKQVFGEYDVVSVRSRKPTTYARFRDEVTSTARSKGVQFREVVV